MEVSCCRLVGRCKSIVRVRGALHLILWCSFLLKQTIIGVKLSSRSFRFGLEIINIIVFITSFYLWDNRTTRPAEWCIGLPLCQQFLRSLVRTPARAIPWISHSWGPVSQPCCERYRLAWDKLAWRATRVYMPGLVSRLYCRNVSCMWPIAIWYGDRWPDRVSTTLLRSWHYYS